MKRTYFKPLHFIVAMIIFFLVCQFINTSNSMNGESCKHHSSLVHIDSTSFFKAIRSDLCFVLFYKSNSTACDNMEEKLSELARNKTYHSHFFKINTASQCDSIIDLYNISGVPNILIFKNGREQRRIMGVISYSNLQMIYQREIR